LFAEFGLSGISNVSFLKVLVDVVDQIVLNSSLKSELNQICQLDPTDLSGLAVIFNATIGKLGIPALSFDPLWKTDLETPGLARDRRSRLYLMCNEVGWFRTAGSGDRHLTPESLSLEWYRRVCSDLFGIDIPDRDKFNAEFGGSDHVVTSTFFTRGSYDVWQPFAVSPLRPRREALVLETGNEMAGADLVGVSEVTDRIVEQLAGWMKSDCDESNCEHGVCYLHSCVCEDGFEGDSCDVVENTVNAYHWVAMAAAFGPTILILATASVAWVLLVHGRSSHMRQMSLV
jgi:hypothetical protein